MQRVLLGLLILVLGAAGLFLFLMLQGAPAAEETHASPVSVAEAPTEEPEPAPAELTTPPVEPAAPAEEVLETPVASPTVAVELDSTRKEAQERARIQGRVLVPEGVPADEDMTVRILSREPKVRRRSSLSVLSEPEAPEDPLLGEVEVNVTGRFEFALALEQGEVWIELDARYLRLEEALQVDLAAETPVDLAPSLGAWIEGRLVVPADATAEELEDMGKTVSLRADPLRSMGAMGMSSGGVRRRYAEPTEERTYEFRGVKTGISYELHTTPDLLTAVKTESFEPEPGAHVVMDLVMTRGARITGRVVDSEGQPVAEAELEVTQDPLMFGQGGFEVREGETDDDGYFDLLAIRPGKSTVKIEADGYIETSKAVTLVEGDHLTAQLYVVDGGNQVTGRVLWANGSPAQDVEVDLHFDLSFLGGLEAFNAMKGANGEDRTDDEGRFTITGLGKGPFTVVATAENEDDAPTGLAGTRPEWRGRQDGVRPGAEVELTLAPPMGIDGLVMNDLGEVITKFKVLARTKTGGMMEGLGAETESSEYEDDEGRFHLDGLSEGDWLVMATADGFGFPEPIEIQVPQADGATLQLVLERAASISGIVLDPSGEPVVGASVGPKFSLGDIGRISSEGRGDQKVASDDQGRFEITGLTPGTISLVASSQEYAGSDPVGIEVQPAELKEDVVLQLRTGGRILGVILDDEGKASPGRTILAQVPTDPGQQRWANSDLNGEFEFDNLEPGTYQVMSFPMGGDDGSPGDVDESNMASFFSDMKFTMAEVVDGEDTEVTLGSLAADPVTVRGRVVSAGKPVAGVLVSFFNDGGKLLQGFKFSNTSSDGRFEFKLDSPGRYLVNVQKITGTGQQQNVEFSREIPEVEDHEILLELPIAGISGTVYDPDRQPAGGARISLSVDGAIRNGSFTGGNYAEIQTDDNGYYELLWLRPGKYSVAAGGNSLMGMFGNTGSGPGRQVRSGLKLKEGQRLTNIDFHLKKPGTIVGSVLDLAGNPVAGAAIFLRDGNGRPLDRFSLIETDPAGHFQYDSLEPGEYSVTARDAGMVSTSATTARVREGQETRIELAIDAGTVLIVSLSDKQGNPVQCSVEVTDSSGRQVNGMWSMSELMTAFGQGGFSSLEQRVGPLPPGKYRVIATTTDGLSANKPVTLRNSMETRKLSLRLN